MPAHHARYTIGCWLLLGLHGLCALIAEPSTGELRRAAGEGNVAAVRELLASGISVDACSETGETALHAAAARGHALVVQLLLRSGASPHNSETVGFTPLHFTAQNGDVRSGGALVEAGALVDASDQMGRAPLHLAAARGHAPMVAMLCARGAVAGAADHTGNTPLHVATSASVGRELLRRGGRALALALNRWNDSAMHEAAWAGRVDVLEALIEVVPSPASGEAVPAWAAWNGRSAAEEEEDWVAAAAPMGETPLLLAARQGHAVATRLLLQHAFCVRAEGAISCAAMRQPRAPCRLDP